jgi:hypothetical protein
VLGAPSSSTEKRQRSIRTDKLKGLISKSLIAPQRALNILTKPENRFRMTAICRQFLVLKY